jgi:hypothetical protein
MAEKPIGKDKGLIKHLPAPPPAGFKPHLATDEELIAAGFPRRPNSETQPKLFALWQKFMSRDDLTYVPCTFTPVEKPSRLLPKDLKKPSNAAGESNNGSTTNWSGAIIEPALPANESFSSCSAMWTVPNVYPPTSAITGTNSDGTHTYEDNTYLCSSWVGIDDSDILQAGTVSRVVVSGGVITTRDAWAWTEWYPTIPSTELAGFPVAPGDTIICTVCAPVGKGATSGSAWFGNTTTGQYHPVGMTAPAGSALIGNMAEFILEDPSYGSSTGGLTEYAFPDFGASFFYNCLAGTTINNGQSQGPEFALKDAWLINIVQNNQTLSTAEADGTVLMMYSGNSGPAN